MGADSGIAVAGAAMLGAALSVVGNLLYLRDVRAGRTVPHRGAWLVWSVIAVVAAAGHGAAGGRWSLLVLSAQALGCLLVLGYAIPRGVGGVTPGNLALVGVAAAGVIGWLTFSDPLAASCSAAVADAAGLIGIIPKIRATPWSETCATYALAATTGMLALLSSQSVDPSVLVFPAYYCIGNALVVQLIARHRRRRDRPPGGSSSGAPAVGQQPVSTVYS